MSGPEETVPAFLADHLVPWAPGRPFQRPPAGQYAVVKLADYRTLEARLLYAEQLGDQWVAMHAKAETQAKQLVKRVTELEAQLAARSGGCLTCSGHGVIGGFVSAESGYATEDCPDCGPDAGEPPKVVVDRELLVRLCTGYRKHLVSLDCRVECEGLSELCDLLDRGDL